MCEDHAQEVTERIAFPAVQRTMTKRKSEMYPMIPTNTTMFTEFLLAANDHLKVNFQGTAYCGFDHAGSIFYSEAFVGRIGNYDSICYDGTFFIVPKIFNQLFVICVKFGPRYLPVFFVLMTRRLKDHYKAVIQKIRQLVPNFEPRFAIGDFEQASMNAFEETFPGIVIKGCLFHFKRAIKHKLGRLNLINYYDTNITANCFFKLFMGLVFLPQNKIRETSDQI